jgi:two-component system phosphate regulon sensor histidine kinase PhoR
VDVVRPLAERKGIALEVEPGPIGSGCYCDAEAVHQVLTNLLDNALKYTPAGGRITVGARLASEGLLEIYVRDTGIGIPSEDVPRLFERFYRVDKARSRELGGTGLGLAIVKHLVRAQGGDVRVQSTPNQGSTFSFTLPAREIHENVTTPSLR